MFYSYHPGIFFHQKYIAQNNYINVFFPSLFILKRHWLPLYSRFRFVLFCCFAMYLYKGFANRFLVASDIPENYLRKDICKVFLGPKQPTPSPITWIYSLYCLTVFIFYCSLIFISSYISILSGNWIIWYFLSER